MECAEGCGLGTRLRAYLISRTGRDETIPENMRTNFPVVLISGLFLFHSGIRLQGIYRVSSSKSTIHSLKEAFDRGM